MTDDPAEDPTANPTPEHVAVFQRMRTLFGDGAARRRSARKKRERPASSVPFGDGRDPHAIGDVLDGLSDRMGWASPLARGDLLAHWSELVGAETAAHAVPAGIVEGVLVVRCDSTAWATQLRLMRGKVTTQIAQRFPEAGIESVRFEGPNAPSWKHGPRSTPGRGPRDTYG